MAGRHSMFCQRCGVEFRIHAYEIAARKYCSRKCHNDTMATGKTGYRGHAGGTRSEHIRIATAALGRPMPAAAEVHHVNENGRDNRPGNLVICEDHAYHFLLHLRAKVLRAGGDPNTQRICYGCKALVVFGGFGAGGMGNSGSMRRVCLRCNARRADERRRRLGVQRRAVGRKYDEMGAT